MAMYDIGRVCLKIAGRDANRKCVIIDTLDANTVLIDGATRRRKCNIHHLEPLNETVDLKKGASTKDVAAALKKLGIEVRETKPKQAAAKPTHVRKKKQKPVKEAKPAKAAKAEPKAEKDVPAGKSTPAAKTAEKTESAPAQKTAEKPVAKETVKAEQKPPAAAPAAPKAEPTAEKDAPKKVAPKADT